jgi:hypothetical protein
MHRRSRPLLIAVLLFAEFPAEAWRWQWCQGAVHYGRELLE